jgi:ADP-ribose pyrophosphatase
MPIPTKPELLLRTAIYQSKWVNLFVDKVKFPNGCIIEQHHLLDFEREAVMAVSCDNNQRYAMVKVCRYPTGRAEWEFPAGSIEIGEDIIEAAKREILEETGHTSTNHEVLYSYNPMNGIANQVFHVVRCETGETIREFDKNEITAVSWFSEEEIWQKIRDREIKDGYTLTAFLLHKHL